MVIRTEKKLAELIWGKIGLRETSAEFLIALYTSRLFGLNVEINGKTSSVFFLLLLFSLVIFEEFLGLYWYHVLIYWRFGHIFLGFPLIVPMAGRKWETPAIFCWLKIYIRPYFIIVSFNIPKKGSSTVVLYRLVLL